MSNVHYQPVDRDLVIYGLQTNEQNSLSAGNRIASEERLEDYIVRRLIDFPDISYDDQADLLYDLAAQMVHHIKNYLANDNHALSVILYYQRQYQGVFAGWICVFA